MKVIEKNFPYDVEDLLSCEYYLLQELEFDLIVFHPYQSISGYLSDANLIECLELTWSGLLLKL
jgi:cyclin-C